jgi:BlaI family transcriptional regulator, penicillinase repressor
VARKSAEVPLTRRERQIMDILFALGSASGHEVRARLEDSPSYSTVRTILRILERKGAVRHKAEGLRYIYEPAVARDVARRSALKRVLHTFFDGSARSAVAALLDPKISDMSRAELDELAQLIEQAKERKP